MSSLVREPRIADVDAFYAELIDAHRGLTAEQSQSLNARLILLLANQVGEDEVVREALKVAKATLLTERPTPEAQAGP